MFNYLIYQVDAYVWILKLYTSDKKLVTTKHLSSHRECLEVVQMLQLHVRQEDRILKIEA